MAQALLMGNFEAAVEMCLAENKMAEAILLAIAGGPELLLRTQRKYFQRNKSNLGRVSGLLGGFFSSVQSGWCLCASESPYMHSALPHRSFPNFAFETVPVMCCFSIDSGLMLFFHD